jgi:putative transposase
MCGVLKVSTSGYYAWIANPKSKRALDNDALLQDINTVYFESNRVYGSIKIKKATESKAIDKRKCKLARINHKRIERLPLQRRRIDLPPKAEQPLT